MTALVLLIVCFVLYQTGRDDSATQYIPSTPLMLAARDGDAKEVEKLILERPDSPKFTDTQGFSALVWASVSGQEGIVDTLLAHGAVVNPPPLQHTAIRGAASRGHVAVVAKLLAKGANVDNPSKGARTGACGYNRPCAQQYVGKSQSCML